MAAAPLLQVGTLLPRRLYVEHEHPARITRHDGLEHHAAVAPAAHAVGHGKIPEPVGRGPFAHQRKPHKAVAGIPCRIGYGHDRQKPHQVGVRYLLLYRKRRLVQPVQLRHQGCIAVHPHFTYHAFSAHVPIIRSIFFLPASGNSPAMCAAIRSNDWRGVRPPAASAQSVSYMASGVQ